MAIPASMTCEVRRVTRCDTVIIRLWIPQIQANCEIPLLLEGVTCGEEAKRHICDWVEIHADFGRLRLIGGDTFRDEYGRLLGDLADMSSGETLTEWLIEQRVATRRPNHFFDIMAERLTAEEPDAGHGAD